MPPEDDIQVDPVPDAPGPVPPTPLEAFEQALVERIAAQTSDDLVVLGRLVDTEDATQRMRALHLVQLFANTAAEQLAELQDAPSVAGQPGALGVPGLGGVFGEMIEVLRETLDAPKLQRRLGEEQATNTALRIAAGDLLDAVNKGDTERAERIRKRLQAALDDAPRDNGFRAPIMPVPMAPYPLTSEDELPPEPNPDIIDAADVTAPEDTP